MDENGNPAPPPGPGQQGGAPTGPAAQGPNEKNWFVWHKLLTALGAILALIVVTVALAGGGGGDGTETAGPGPAPATTTSQAADDQPAEQPKHEEPQVPGLKDPVVSGDLEFTVNSIKCGIRKVGPSGFEDRPQGQFCRLNVRVENIGDEEQQVFGEDQKLIDNQGRQHTHDAGATTAANDEGGGDLWIGNINPGNVIKGDIMYDISKNAKPVEVQVRGDLFEDAVTVELK